MRNNSWVYLLIAACCMPVFCFGAELLPVKTNAPIHIESDTVVFDQVQSALTYQGNVIVTSGDQKLYATQVVVVRDKQQEIQSIVATGAPARYTQVFEKDKTTLQAYANQIDFDPKQSILLLTGKAKITHQQDTFEGPLLKYMLNEHKIEAIQANNERPKMIIHPTERI